MLHIEPRLEMFLEKSLIAFPQDEIIEHDCFFCKRSIRYPLVARQSDVEHMQILIDLANKWLDENGVTERMMRELLNTLLNKMPEIQAIQILKEMKFGEKED